MPKTSVESKNTAVETKTRYRSAPAPRAEAESAKKCLPISAEEVLAGVRDLPAMPNVVIKIMRMTGKGETSSPKELSSIIAQDPNFSARILKMANSAYYGLPRSVSTLSDAVLMLGNHSIRNIAMLAATKDTLRQKIEGYELRPGELWRHSLMCALASQLLAEQTFYHDKEVAFVGGLLHDVGKLVLGPYVHDRLPAIRETIAAQGCSFVEAERAVLGFDHAEIGGRIALHWNLPSALVSAISLHHNPVQKECVSPLVALVYLGNLICFSSADSSAVGGSSETNKQCMEVLHLKEKHISSVILNLQEQMEKVPLLSVE